MPQTWFTHCFDGIRSARQAADPSASLRHFREAARLSPASVAARVCLGIRLQAEGDLDGARHHLDVAVHLSSSSPSAFLASRALRCRALLRYATQDLADAVADLNAALRLDPAFAEALYLRGMIAMDLDDADACIGDMSACLAIAPTAGHAYAMRGTARAARHDRAGALHDLGRALDHDLNDADRAALLFSRAHLHGDDDPDAAMDDLSASIALRPHPRSLMARADLHDRLGDARHAIADLEHAVRIGGGRERRDARHRLARSHFSARRYRDALQQYEEIVGSHDGDDDDEALLGRARCLARLARFRRAVHDFSTVLGRRPGAAHVRGERGLALYALRQYRRARPDLAAAVSHDPGNDAVRWAWTQVENALASSSSSVDRRPPTIRRTTSLPT
ncbi:Tetratricopeptide repeat [Plasmodiophora brassicae]